MSVTGDVTIRAPTATVTVPVSGKTAITSKVSTESGKPHRRSYADADFPTTESDSTPGPESEPEPEPERDLEPETPLADGRVVESGDRFYPTWLTNQEWWINWVLTYDEDDDPEDGDKPRKQPCAPYREGNADPVLWKDDLPDDEDPKTTLETVRPWQGTRIGRDIHVDSDYYTVVSDEIDIGIIIPLGQGESGDVRPVTFIDYDDVRDPETGKVHPVVARTIRETDCYVEISQSGEGVHLFVFGTIPGGQRKFIRYIDDEPFVGDDRPAVEMYTSGRVCAMTGRHVAGSGDDVTEEQDVIDDLCWEFGTADNASDGTPTDPHGRRIETDTESESDDGRTTPDHATVGEAMRRSVSYDGPDPDEWDIPDDESIEYHAVLRARERSDELSGTANWELIGYAAAFGYRDGLEKAEILADLRDHPTPQYGYDERRATREIESVFRKIEKGDYEPPSRQTLVDRGILPELDGGDRVTALPFGALTALNPDEQRRYLKKRGVDWPSTPEVQEQICDTLVETMESEGYTVAVAPTGSGKTGTVATTDWIDEYEGATGGKPVVVFCGTRDARDELVDRAEANGADVFAPKGRKEVCPVAAGEYDPANVDEEDDKTPVTVDGEPASEWIDRHCDEKNIPFSVTHKRLESELRRSGEHLPCCPGDCQCGATTQWPSDGLTDRDGVPRFDLIVATDPFAFVPSLRSHTNVIQDEQPDYTEDFGIDRSDYGSYDAYLDAINSRIRRAVTTFLRDADVGPDTFEELVSLARQCAEFDAKPWNEHATPDDKPPEALADRWIDTYTALSHEPDRNWYFDYGDAHTLAPALARAIFDAIVENGIAGSPGTGPYDENGRADATVPHQPPRLDADARDDAGWNLTRVSLVIDDENRIRTVRHAPDFSTARSVVGLDARPTLETWQRNVAADLTVENVLDTDERQLWRRFERGQTVVQVGDATRPAGRDGKYFTESHARALIDKLRDAFDDWRAVGCAGTVEAEIRELMADAGIPEDEIASLHYGEEKSRNPEAFVKATTGLVYGCIDPGDDYVLDLLAECGLDAEPETTVDGDGDEHRAHGRGFVGPDADRADALLESVRATHVAQMVGRFGRDLDDGDQNVTFVATDAVPPDLVDHQVDGVVRVSTPLQRQIVGALEDRPSATTRELADDLGCTKEHVRKTLSRLADRDDPVVERRAGIGPFGADVWSSERAGPVDDVDLGDGIANDAVHGTNTWSLAIHDRLSPSIGSATVGDGSDGVDRPATADGPPPGPDD